MLVCKLWTVYTGMFAVTAILSCVIKIHGLFKSTKCGRLKMSNLKLSQPGVIPFNNMKCMFLLGSPCLIPFRVENVFYA